jgi:hypothetical protein
MRKLICVLITLTFAFPSLSTAATKKKLKPKPDKYAALKKRVIGFWDEYNRQFQLQNPDGAMLLRYVLPTQRDSFSIEYQKQVDDPSRLVEIRNPPVDVKRIISIASKSKTVVKVEFCWVRSLRSVRPDQTIPADISIVGLEGERSRQEWKLSKDTWYLLSAETTALYEKEEQCRSAK